MALTASTNVVSLNVQHNVNTPSKKLSASLQRLSSGLRINSAKGNIAVLDILQIMTTQINATNVAMCDVNDGVSLAQTAEGSSDGVSNAR